MEEAPKTATREVRKEGKPQRNNSAREAEPPCGSPVCFERAGCALGREQPAPPPGWRRARARGPVKERHGLVNPPQPAPLVLNKQGCRAGQGGDQANRGKPGGERELLYFTPGGNDTGYYRGRDRAKTPVCSNAVQKALQTKHMYVYSWNQAVWSRA